MPRELSKYRGISACFCGRRKDFLPTYSKVKGADGCLLAGTSRTSGHSVRGIADDG